MALLHSIQELLALAQETSLVDDQTLDALGRRVLEAVVDDPDVPEQIREQAARVLRGSTRTSSSGAPYTDGLPD